MSTNNEVCAHDQALMCDVQDLHIANQSSMYFYCVECGEFLNDEMLVVEGNPLQEDLSSPRHEAGEPPAYISTSQEAPGQPEIVPGTGMLLGGVSHANVDPTPGNQSTELLPVDSSSVNKNGKGSNKATKLSEQEKIEKYGRILPGPWHGIPCPNSLKKCHGLMEAFYTLEFEEGNSYMYKCSVCSVITSISFRESKIKHND